MHYAWQAGILFSIVSFSIRLAAFQASGGACIEIHLNDRIPNPDEPELTIQFLMNRYALSVLNR
jgi:hypothetical protein